MQTRLSSKLARDQTSNPTSSTNPTPKGRIRRSSKQKVENSHIEEHLTPVATMTDNRTMAEMLRAPTEGCAEAIVVPPILAEEFELKHSLINIMTSEQLFGLEKDNPHDHIRWFNKITSTINYKDVPNSLPVCYDDDDDEERSNSLKDNIISELPPCAAITPNEPVDSLSMGNEHLDIIPAMELDEFIKSSVENLIPIPKEVDAFLAVEDEPTSSQFPQLYLDPEGDILLLEAFLNDDHSSDFKTKSSSTSLNSLLEETNNFDNSLPKFTTFLNVLFDAEYESNSSDDQSCSDETFQRRSFRNLCLRKKSFL
nr:reverse transcriptase domain-containing protein [Tanacetum cinerariifolium]